MKSAAQRKHVTKKKGKHSTSPTAAQLAAAAELATWQHDIQQDKENRLQQQRLMAQQAEAQRVVPQHVPGDIRNVLSDLYPQLYTVPAPSLHDTAKFTVQEESKEQTVSVGKSGVSKTKRATAQKHKTVERVVLPVIAIATPPPAQPVIQPIDTTQLHAVEYIKLPSIVDRSVNQLQQYSQSVDFEKLAKQQKSALYPTFTQPRRLAPVTLIEHPPLRFIDEKHYRQRLKTKQPVVCTHAEIVFDSAWCIGDVHTQRVTVTNNSTHSVRLNAQIQRPCRTLHVTVADSSVGSVASGMGCQFDITFRPSDLTDFDNAVTFRATNATTHESNRQTIDVPIRCVRPQPVLQYGQCTDSVIQLGCVLHEQQSNALSTMLYNHSDVDTAVSFKLSHHNTETASWLSLLSPVVCHLPAQSSTVLQFNVDTSNIHLSKTSPTTVVQCTLYTLLDNQQSLQHTVSVTVSSRSLIVSSISATNVPQPCGMIDFGNVCVCDTVERVITLQNNGAVPCRYNVVLTDGDNGGFSVTADSDVVPANNVCQILVQYTNSNLQTSDAQLQLVNADTDDLIGDWTLRAATVLPSMCMQPDTLMCQPTCQYSTQQYAITVHNDSNVPCAYQLTDTTTDNITVNVEPKQLIVLPHAAQQVHVTVTCTEVPAMQWIHLQCSTHPVGNATLSQQLTLTICVPATQHQTLMLDAQTVPFDVVPVGSIATRQLTITNSFAIRVNCQLHCDDSRVVIFEHHSCMELPPYSTASVDITLDTGSVCNIDTVVTVKSSVCAPQNVHVTADIQQPFISIVCNDLQEPVTMYQTQSSAVYTVELYNDSSIPAQLQFGSVYSTDKVTQLSDTSCFRLLASDEMMLLAPHQRRSISLQFVSDTCGVYNIVVPILIDNSAQTCGVAVAEVLVKPVNLTATVQSVHQQVTMHQQHNTEFELHNPTLAPVNYSATLLHTDLPFCYTTLSASGVLQPGQTHDVLLDTTVTCPGDYNNVVQIDFSTVDSGADSSALYIPLTVQCRDVPLALKSDVTPGLHGNMLKLTAQPTLQRIHIQNHTECDVLYRPTVYDHNIDATHYYVCVNTRVDDDGDIDMMFDTHIRQNVDSAYAVQIQSHELLIPALGSGVISLTRPATLPRGMHALIHGLLYVQDDIGEWQLAHPTFGMQQLDVHVIA